MEQFRNSISSFYDSIGTSSTIVISIAIILFCGFLMTRLTKLLKLPNVTAYIFTGIIIGPCCFGLITKQMIDGMSFLADIATAFIAFGVGEYFRLSVWKSNGIKAVIVTLFEAIITSLVVFLFLFLFFSSKIGLPYIVLLASIAGATTPTSTMIVIRQNKAKGEFVDLLLQVMALDIALSLIVFSISLSVVTASTSGNAGAWEIIKPILFNFGSLIVGIGFGFLLKLLITKRRANDNRLIISIATLFAFCALAEALNVSPLLGCMAMGMTYINASKDEKIFKQLNYFSPPFLLLFFVRSGMNFDITKLSTLGLIGLCYFLCRIVGKYLGAFIGGIVTKKDKKIRNYLGLALFPQTSIAISLAALCSQAIGGEMGLQIETVIVASALLNEVVGPICSRLALSLAGTFTVNQTSEKVEKITPKILLEEDKKEKKSLDEIIEEHMERNKMDASLFSEQLDEQAFDQAIEESETYINSIQRQLRTRK